MTPGGRSGVGQVAPVTRSLAAPQSHPRWFRGGVLALVSTLLGVAVHAAAGGTSPHPSVLLPLAVVTAAAGAGLAGENPCATRVIGVLAAAQLVMQVLFVLGHRAHPHTGALAGPVTMIAGQLAAIIAIGLLLVHADSVLVCLADAVAAARPVWWTRPAAPLVAARPRWTGDHRRRHGVLLARSCPRRGPPTTD